MGVYFNGLIGEDYNLEIYLIFLVLFVVLGKRDFILIFGIDYNIFDGICIWDYIYVCDLVDVYVLGLEYLLNGGESDIFNLGNGNGFLVREVIEIVKEVIGREFRVEECDCWFGDLFILVGSSEKVRKVLGWFLKYLEVKEIVVYVW